MINIFLLNTSHALGSFENVNEEISEMMDISTETNITIKKMYMDLHNGNGTMIEVSIISFFLALHRFV